MYEGIRGYLTEMIEDRLKLEISDDVSDIVDEYIGYIIDGVTEGYYASGNYVVDCNLREKIISDEKTDIQNLKDELSMLYKAISSKGYNLHYENGVVYRTGIEHVGGTISASYTRKIL